MAQHIEAMLRNWEDCIFLNLLEKRMNGSPTSFDWTLLRKELLNVKPKQENLNEKFHYKFGEELVANNLIVEPVAGIPLMLAAWCATSRRVFSVNERLGDYLAETAIDNIEWQDVDPPFQVFGIELEKSLQLPRSEYSTNFILALFGGQDDDEQQTFGFYIPNSEITGVSFLTDKRREYLFNLYEKKKWGDLRQEIRVSRNKLNAIQYLKIALPSPTGKGIVESVEEHIKDWMHDARSGTLHKTRMSAKAREETHKIVRVCINLCLYLNVVGRVRYLKITEHDAPTRQDGNMHSRGKRMVTDTARVCRIEAIIPVSEERVVTDRGGKGSQKSPHPRRGYHRRRRGEGNNPSAPRVIPVPPTYIHPERVLDGELPIAKQSRIS